MQFGYKKGDLTIGIIIAVVFKVRKAAILLCRTLNYVLNAKQVGHNRRRKYKHV